MRTYRCRRCGALAIYLPRPSLVKSPDLNGLCKECFARASINAVCGFDVAAMRLIDSDGQMSAKDSLFLKALGISPD